MPTLWGGYYVLFSDFMNADWPSCINGTHLWYLPMLFVCSLILSSKVYIKRYSNIIIWVSWLLAIIVYQFTGLRTLIEVFCYQPVMHMGYLYNEKSEGNVTYQQLCLYGVLLLLPLVVILLLGMYRLRVANIVEYLMVGFLSYLFISKARNADKKCGSFMKIISNNSFAIYLIHQFVINILLILFAFKNINFYVSTLIIFITALLIPISVSELYNKVQPKWIKS